MTMFQGAFGQKKSRLLAKRSLRLLAKSDSWLPESNKETPKVQYPSFAGIHGNTGNTGIPGIHGNTGTRVMLGTALFCCKAAEKALIPLCSAAKPLNQVVLDSPVLEEPDPATEESDPATSGAGS